MRKLFSFIAAVLFAGSMMAAEVTILPSDFTPVETSDYSTVKSGVTVAVTASTVTADQMRIFKGKTITISADVNITKIVFTCTANGTAKYGPGCFAAQDGYTFEAEGKTGTWAGEAKSVVFTAETNQVRATEIVVTLEGEGGGEDPDEVVIYDWANKTGVTVLGKSGVEETTVKIHENKDAVNAIKFGSSYVYADGKYIVIKPAEGGFKAGDVLYMAAVFNNANENLDKYAQVDLRAADGDTRIWLSDSASTINGRFSAEDPIVQTYKLEADQDSLFLGRYGNTALFIVQLLVGRPEAEPQPTMGYYVVGTMTDWKANANYKLKANPAAEGEFMGEFAFKANDGFKVAYSDGATIADDPDAWFPSGMENEYKITEDGDYAVYFRPDGQGGEGWHYGYIYVAKKEAPVGPQNLGPKTIAEFLELKNTVDTCILTGVVSNITNTTYGNFDLTDATGKVYVYGLLTAAGESKKFAELGVAENDTLTVKAIYNEHNNNPQAKNAIFVEVKKSSAPVVEPQNLGEKTIAEFLELKNTVDTCILTGVVSNITNTTYGNFDLTDATGKVYVYGLLTAAGESKKFAELGVAENDTLTVKAIYNEHNNNPQAKNAIFVEVKKSSAPVVEPQNLGEKTIAEFLELKNRVDTCILTGTVKNIVMDTQDPTKPNIYGNFDLEDTTASVYVYGLLTPEGEAKKFQEMGIVEGDVITIKALYNEYNNNPQVKNAILVRKKGQGLDNTDAEVKVEKFFRDGQLIIRKNGVEYNAQGAIVR